MVIHCSLKDGEVYSSVFVESSQLWSKIIVSND